MKTWKQLEALAKRQPSREAENEARQHRPGPHPESCVCGGEGWLWGHELPRPPEVVTDTRYQCDRDPEDLEP